MTKPLPGIALAVTMATVFLFTSTSTSLTGLVCQAQ